MASRRILLGAQNRGSTLTREVDEPIDRRLEVRSRRAAPGIDAAVLPIELRSVRSAAEFAAQEDVVDRVRAQHLDQRGLPKVGPAVWRASALVDPVRRVDDDLVEPKAGRARVAAARSEAAAALRPVPRRIGLQGLAGLGRDHRETRRRVDEDAAEPALVRRRDCARGLCTGVAQGVGREPGQTSRPARLGDPLARAAPPLLRDPRRGRHRAGTRSPRGARGDRRRCGTLISGRRSTLAVRACVGAM